jgi:hypothetical protein
MTTIDAAAARTPRRFYVTMALVITAVVLVGFAPSFYLKDFIHAPPPLSDLTRLHGFIFTSWLAMFIAQTSLVAANRTDLHMKLGIAGAILAGVIVVLGVYTGIVAGKLGHAPPASPPPIPFMAIPLFNMVGFAVLIVTALFNRKRATEVHKRSMLMASIVMTEPAFARMPLALGAPQLSIIFAYGGADVLLLAAVAYDYRTSKRVHPAYLWGAVLIVGLQVATIIATQTEGWANFAAWLTTLV